MDGTWHAEFPDEHHTAPELLSERLNQIEQWLRQNAPESQREQKHLDAGTPEQVYWHYGYMVALRDALNLLNRNFYSAGTSNRNWLAGPGE